MELVLLKRFQRNDDQGTFGSFTFKGNLLVPQTKFSGELKWRDDANGISCLPPDRDYVCLWTYSPHFRRFVYLVTGDNKRFGVRIHPANYMGVHPPYRCQLEGCIALGNKIGVMAGQKALLLSRPAISDFERAMDGKPFILRVREAA